MVNFRPGPSSGLVTDRPQRWKFARVCKTISVRAGRRTWSPRATQQRPAVGSKSSRGVQLHGYPGLVDVGWRLGPYPDGYGLHLEGTHLSGGVSDVGVHLSGFVTGSSQQQAARQLVPSPHLGSILRQPAGPGMVALVVALLDLFQVVGTGPLPQGHNWLAPPLVDGR
jgi:hypothetical protein